MNLTLLQATDENGQEVATPFRNGGGWAGHFALDFPNPRVVKVLNLKLALHKSRSVEFTVTPHEAIISALNYQPSTNHHLTGRLTAPYG